MTKWLLCLLQVVLIVFVSLRAYCDGMTRPSLEQLSRVRAELVELETSHGGETAADEIGIAKGWLEKEEALFKKGKLEQASMLAERLVAQLDLVRVLVSVEKELREVRRLEDELSSIETRLKQARERLETLETEWEDAVASRRRSREKGGAE